MHFWGDDDDEWSSECSSCDSDGEDQALLRGVTTRTEHQRMAKRHQQLREERQKESLIGQSPTLEGGTDKSSPLATSRSQASQPSFSGELLADGSLSPAAGDRVGMERETLAKGAAPPRTKSMADIAVLTAQEIEELREMERREKLAFNIHITLRNGGRSHVVEKGRTRPWCTYPCVSLPQVQPPAIGSIRGGSQRPIGIMASIWAVIFGVRMKRLLNRSTQYELLLQKEMTRKAELEQKMRALRDAAPGGGTLTSRRGASLLVHRRRITLQRAIADAVNRSELRARRARLKGTKQGATSSEASSLASSKVVMSMSGSYPTPRVVLGQSLMESEPSPTSGFACTSPPKQIANNSSFSEVVAAPPLALPPAVTPLLSDFLFDQQPPLPQATSPQSSARRAMHMPQKSSNPTELREVFEKSEPRFSLQDGTQDASAHPNRRRSRPRMAVSPADPREERLPSNQGRSSVAFPVARDNGYDDGEVLRNRNIFILNPEWRDLPYVTLENRNLSLDMYTRQACASKLRAFTRTPLAAATRSLKGALATSHTHGLPHTARPPSTTAFGDPRTPATARGPERHCIVTATATTSTAAGASSLMGHEEDRLDGQLSECAAVNTYEQFMTQTGLEHADFLRRSCVEEKRVVATKHSMVFPWKRGAILRMAQRSKNFNHSLREAQRAIAGMVEQHHLEENMKYNVAWLNEVEIMMRCRVTELAPVVERVLLVFRAYFACDIANRHQLALHARIGKKHERPKSVGGDRCASKEGDDPPKGKAARSRRGSRSSTGSGGRSGSVVSLASASHGAPHAAAVMNRGSWSEADVGRFFATAPWSRLRSLREVFEFIVRFCIDDDDVADFNAQFTLLRLLPAFPGTTVEHLRSLLVAKGTALLILDHAEATELAEVQGMSQRLQRRHHRNKLVGTIECTNMRYQRALEPRANKAFSEKREEIRRLRELADTEAAEADRERQDRFRDASSGSSRKSRRNLLLLRPADSTLSTGMLPRLISRGSSGHLENRRQHQTPDRAVKQHVDLPHIRVPRRNHEVVPVILTPTAPASTAATPSSPSPRVRKQSERLLAPHPHAKDGEPLTFRSHSGRSVRSVQFSEPSDANGSAPPRVWRALPSTAGDANLQVKEWTRSISMTKPHVASPVRATIASQGRHVATLDIPDVVPVRSPLCSPGA